MSPNSYDRFLVRSTDLTCWAVVILAGLMWLATLADHFLRLGWGWDVQIIWVAPIIIGGGLLVRKLSRRIYRWVGALK
jgi:hypothetical protein